jgi:sigma-54 dependent transcriptional regulator
LLKLICCGATVNESNANKLVQFPQSAASRPAPRDKSMVSFHAPSTRLLHDIERIAPTRATVLLVGETGTGKELAARRIHERSGLSGPFVPVNCGALSEQLIEAELFGHEAGAFTGAQQARAGWFETAQGGTLFLDEIGDMPLALQVKLLRVLQERQVVRLGSRKPTAFEVRLIAATNLELGPAVEAGQFRRDLFHRLNVASLRLPPLRERCADILPLARHFIEVYGAQLGLGEVRLSAGAERVLLTHTWPGNVRELENAIHRALIVTDGPLIEAYALGIEASGIDTAHGIAGPLAEASNEFAFLAEAVRRLLASEQQSIFESAERLLVITAFEHCGGNQVRTARRLGISRNILRALLKRHGLLAVREKPVSTPRVVTGPRPSAQRLLRRAEAPLVL